LFGLFFCIGIPVALYVFVVISSLISNPSTP
jgi:hypothetical protein